MEDKLEPNMYVRLNCNYELGIGKTIGEIDEDNFIKTKFKDGFECSLPTYMIKKASHNIVDLIEVGDVITTNNLCGEVTKIDIENNEIWIACCDYETCRSEDIKSVVTKEMFSNVEYRVETN